MSKEFLTLETIRDNALLLAERIYKDGFIPTVIYVGLRGGTSMGNAISEYFKLVSPRTMPPLYAAVVAHSYDGQKSRSSIHIDGWTYDPEFLRLSDKVLLVDDIFDSGLTINVIADAILSRGLPEENLKIAVHDYKIRHYDEHVHTHIPHYYSRKIEIAEPKEDNWIHYLSHELDGLTDEELTTHYGKNVQGLIRNLLDKRKSLSEGLVR